MGSKTDLVRPIYTSRSVICARVATALFGIAAIVWAGFVAPIAWEQQSMMAIGKKIISGERFEDGSLANFIDAAAPYSRSGICQPVTLRTIATIRLRLAEEAIADGNRDLVNQSQSALVTALRQSLSCTPTDPFLWFAVFWIQNNMRGLQTDNFNALRLSYHVGPNEGWLCILRNRFAIAIYPQLPDDLKQYATDEFVQLVKSAFVSEAAEIVAGPGRPISGMLLTRLAGIDSEKLKFLSRLLDGKDFDGVVPGVVNPARGPYRSTN